MVLAGVSSNDAHAVVVAYIVDILQTAFHLRVTAFVVSPKTMCDRPVPGFVGDGTKTLWIDPLAYDTISESDVRGTNDVNVIPSSPRNRDMIQDAVRAVVHRQCTFRFVHSDAATHADIADNNI